MSARRSDGSTLSPPKSLLVTPARAAAILAAALAAFWLLASLWFPPGRDQGVFLWIGDVVLEGGAPYRDAWETKGPVVFALSALVRGITGAGTWGIRLFDAIFAALTVLLCVRMLRTAGAWQGVTIAVLILVVAHTSLGWWDSAQPDGWATTFMTGSLACALASVTRVGSHRSWLLIASGALLGVAALIKPFYALFAIVPAAALFAWGTISVRDLLAGALGTIIAAAAVMIWMIASGSDVLAAFIDVHLRFNARVYATLGRQTLPERASLFLASLAALAVLPAVAFAVVAPMLVRRRARAGQQVAPEEHRVARALAAAGAVWTILAATWVFIQGKFWPYQWIPLFPPLALLAGLTVASLGSATTSGLPSPRTRSFLLWALVAAIALGGLSSARWAGAWVRDVVFRRDFVRWHAHFGDYGLIEGYLPATARYLRSRVPAGESVLVWGMEPVVYALSGRRPATRYGVHLPLVLGGDTPERRAEQEQFLHDMSAQLPSRVVILNSDRNQLLPRSSSALVRSVPGWAALLERAYAPDTMIGNAVILRRR